MPSFVFETITREWDWRIVWIIYNCLMSYSICVLCICFSCKSAHGCVYNSLFDSVCECVANYANERRGRWRTDNWNSFYWDAPDLWLIYSDKPKVPPVYCLVIILLMRFLLGECVIVSHHCIKYFTPAVTGRILLTLQRQAVTHRRVQKFANDHSKHDILHDLLAMNRLLLYF
jgi:hypothetical protein